jgi:2-keto-4-pentenoate hydratase/2-oxohepta-3-ene-1,7-dioic acid hydratase in catechol pathway
MRLCRFEQDGKAQAGFYFDNHIVPVAAAAKVAEGKTDLKLSLGNGDDLLPLLPHGKRHEDAKLVAAWLEKHSNAVGELAAKGVRLRTPVPRPNKLFLLAGNYAKHIEEGGGIAVARAKTFPYVFMKPASTALNHPDGDIPIPKVSPDHIDWECELAFVIGKTAKGVKEADALKHVAGYTVVNDISDREFKPNPEREERKNDGFFDWLHGKWHDGFCPVGPCITSADVIPDPQKLQLTLKVNGELKQNASTTLQIFPVAAVIEFISSYVTLEPGDIISTGTPAGVGNAEGTYLKAGDKLEAAIEGIGVLKNTMVLR